MVEWSHAFGGAPIYVPAADREWVQRDDSAIMTWSGTRKLAPGVSLIQCGGHFEGSAVLHWAAGAENRGALLVGDSITVVPDVRFVSFMRSYPNLIPLPADEIRRIVDRVRPYRFDRIYGGWWDRVVDTGGIAAIEKSAERYLRWIGSDVRLVVHGDVSAAAEAFWRDLKSRYDLLRGDRDRPFLEPRELYMRVEDLFAGATGCVRTGVGS